LSDTGSQLLRSEAYAWREEPYRLRKAVLTPEEILALRKKNEKPVEAPAPPPPVTDPETFAALRATSPARRYRANRATWPSPVIAPRTSTPSTT